MATGKPIGSFYVQLGLNTKEFQKNLKGANRELQQAFGSSAIRTSELLAAAMAGLAVAVAGVAAASVKMAADLERQQVSFTRLMGSAGAAKERLQETANNNGKLLCWRFQQKITFFEHRPATPRKRAY